jgi:hypothetical protein
VGIFSQYSFADWDNNLPICWRVGGCSTPPHPPCSAAPARKNTQVVTDLQTSCNKVVVKLISGCVRTACSQSLWQVWNKLYHLVTRLMMVTDLLQVVPTRLIQAVRNKLLRACWHQLVNNWEQAVRTHLVGKLWDFYECNLASKAKGRIG